MPKSRIFYVAIMSFNAIREKKSRENFRIYSKSITLNSRRRTNYNLVFDFLSVIFNAQKN